MKTTETREHNRYTAGDVMVDIAMVIWLLNSLWFLLMMVEGA